MKPSVDELLQELASTGWTVSWAFQYAANDWRASIIRDEDVGGEQGTYQAHCACAHSLAEALEDCISKRTEAEWEAAEKVNGTQEPSRSRIDISKLLVEPVKIQRRF